MTFARATGIVRARVSDPAIQRSLSVAGSRLEAVELPGDPSRRPLVLLHEGLGSVGLWRDFPQALQAATGRRTLVFSRFGHGRSEPPPSPRTPAFFHEEALEVLPAVLEQLDAAEPLLVGHSDGASIALIHAGHHPVAGIALLAPHVIVEDVTVAAIRDARAAFTPARCASAWRATTTTPGRLQRLVRRLARSGLPRLEPRGRRRAGVLSHAADPGRGRPLRHARAARSHRGARARAGATGSSFRAATARTSRHATRFSTLS